jgi:DNA-binding NarL/FixJ family response regulator
MPIRVVLIEDNDVFRQALELLLGQRGDIEIVASASSGDDAVELCRAHEPGVMIVDYRLPGLDGVQATTAVKTACPEVAVVCLTASANAAEMKALRAAGATTCLTKDTELDSIVDALVAAARSMR